MLLMTLFSMFACTPDEPAPEPIVEEVRALPGHVQLTLPDDLSGERALEVASFHATVSDLDGWVFDVGSVRSTAHRFALTDEEVTGAISVQDDSLAVSICRPECQTFVGDGVSLAADVARLLDPEGERLEPWPLPTGKSLKYARRSALLMYELVEPVKRRRIGSRHDAAARAPREAGATTLVSWMQGHRDVRIGRSVPGAQALERVSRERRTPTSVYGMASGYLSAGWQDEAWEAVRHLPRTDLRFDALVGHIAHERGRSDVVAQVLNELPHHPERHRLAFTTDASQESLDAWQASAPEDADVWMVAWTHALRLHDVDALARLLESSPEPLAGVDMPVLESMLKHVDELSKLMDEAEESAELTSLVQNQYAERRSKGPVSCADEAMTWVDEAYDLGVRHRDLVQSSREPRAALAKVLNDPRVRAGVGATYRKDLGELVQRFDDQMRASKVIRSYHERILLGRICPDRT